jgi:hypothetical protein
VNKLKEWSKSDKSSASPSSRVALLGGIRTDGFSLVCGQGRRGPPPSPGSDSRRIDGAGRGADTKGGDAAGAAGGEVMVIVLLAVYYICTTTTSRISYHSSINTSTFLAAWNRVLKVCLGRDRLCTCMSMYVQRSSRRRNKAYFFSGNWNATQHPYQVLCVPQTTLLPVCRKTTSLFRHLPSRWKCLTRDLHDRQSLFFSIGLCRCMQILFLVRLHHVSRMSQSASQEAASSIPASCHPGLFKCC